MSKYSWSISDSGIVFTNGVIKIPLSRISGYTNSANLHLLKRTTPGNPWTDIGGSTVNGYLVSTVTFNSFSEFAIGSTDAQPLAGTFMLIKAIPYGFYNAGANALNMCDTVSVYLRNINSPYAIIDSAIAVIDSLTFSGCFVFKNAPTGIYYIIVKHRNSLETWSLSGGTSVTQLGTMNYDFATSQGQAFGNNLVQVGTKWCLINGDCNGDGYIDGSDYLEVINHYDESGYIIGDTNGDGYVDGSDYLAIINNYDRGVMTPASPMRKVSPRKNTVNKKVSLLKELNK